MLAGRALPVQPVPPGVQASSPKKELLDLLCSPFTAQALGLFAADDQDALAQGAEMAAGPAPAPCLTRT